MNDNNMFALRLSREQMDVILTCLGMGAHCYVFETLAQVTTQIAQQVVTDAEQLAGIEAFAAAAANIEALAVAAVRSDGQSGNAGPVLVYSRPEAPADDVPAQDNTRSLN
jgi:hypothetical protein